MYPFTALKGIIAQDSKNEPIFSTSGFNPGQKGFAIYGNGNIYAYNGVFSGTVYAEDGNFSGNLFLNMTKGNNYVTSIGYDIHRVPLLPPAIAKIVKFSINGSIKVKIKTDLDGAVIRVGLKNTIQENVYSNEWLSYIDFTVNKSYQNTLEFNVVAGSYLTFNISENQTFGNLAIGVFISQDKNSLPYNLILLSQDGPDFYKESYFDF